MGTPEVHVLLLASSAVFLGPPPADALADFPVVGRDLAPDRAARPCDLARELTTAIDAPEDDPGATVARVLSCDTSGPMPPWRSMAVFRLGKDALDRAPSEPDEIARTLDVMELGQAARYGSLVDQMVGLALELSALDALAPLVPALDPADRAWLADALGERMDHEPRFALDVEEALAPWLVRGTGPLGWYLVWDARGDEDRLEHVLDHGTAADLAATAAEADRAQEDAWWRNPLTTGVAKVLAEGAEDEARLRARVDELRAELER